MPQPHGLGSVVPEVGRVLRPAFFEPTPRAALLVWERLRAAEAYHDEALGAGGVAPFRRLTSLAAHKQAGLRFLSPAIVQSTFDWDYRVCLARGHGPDMLEQELIAWRSAVSGLAGSEEEAQAALVFYDALLETHDNRVQRARQILAVPPGTSLNAEQSRLLDCLISGDEDGAMAMAPKAYGSLMGETLPWWEQVVAPVMGVVGRLWECGAINVGRQHLASHIVDQAVREQWVLSPGPGAGATPVVIVLPEREEHALGADMAAILLRANGRKPLIIHAEGPASDWLVEFCVAQRAEAVFLAATMPSTLLHLEKTISGIRSMLGNACPPLITAGAAFAADASLASHSGGDFHFDSLRALAQWAQSSS